MLSQDTPQTLMRSQRDPGRPALSVYLDVDQSKPRNRNREFEVTLAGLLRPLGDGLAEKGPELELLHGDAARAVSFVKVYKPDAMTLVLFSDQTSDLFWVKGLHVPLRERAVWGSGLFLRPLVEALDEYEAYVVALADRERARLFLGCMGELEEFADLLEPDGRHRKTVGTDHWRSQANFQRHAEEHARSHAYAVVQALLQADRGRSFDRLILAGGAAVRSQIELALPKRLRRKIAASVNLPVDASQKEVLEVVQRIEEQAERREEVQIVEALLTAAGKGRRATVGLEKTLQAVARGEVHKLVYADSFLSDTGACLNCGAIQPDKDARCERCEERPEPAERLVDAVVNRVECDKGKVEVVKGNAADLMMRENDGIGAFLRF
jgi:Bacterial archaeo-eukaryotic release factor family 10